jgi:hypothetical protein
VRELYIARVLVTGLLFDTFVPMNEHVCMYPRTISGMCGLEQGNAWVPGTIGVNLSGKA